jgi:hypothetical protein
VWWSVAVVEPERRVDNCFIPEPISPGNGVRVLTFVGGRARTVGIRDGTGEAVRSHPMFHEPLGDAYDGR